MALDPKTLSQTDDGRGYRQLEPGGLTATDGRNYAKRQMYLQEQNQMPQQQQRMVRNDPGQLAGAQVPGTLVPIDAPTSVKLADISERHADMFNADDLAVINAAVVELQDYEFKNSPQASAPVNLDVPYASQEADVLRCTMGNWDGTPTSYSYQWAFDGVDAGTAADVSDYVLVDNTNTGKSATCTVSATNDAGTTEAPPSNPITIADPTTQAAREA